MDDNSANIDLLFRNGLKDLEVLPPHEVWTNIKPVIRKKIQPFILLRTAAMIIMLVSITILAYQWSRQFAIPEANRILAVNEVASPVVNAVITDAVKPSLENSRSNVPVITEESQVEENQPITEDIVREENIISQVDMGNVSLERDAILPESRLALVRGNMTDYTIPEVIEYEYVADNEQENRSPRWSLSALASPTYYNGLSSSGDELTKQLVSSEQTRVSYSGGVSFSYQLGKKLSIQSGIYYSTIGQEVGGIGTYGGFSDYDYTKGGPNFRVLTSSGTIYTNNSDIFLIDRSGDRVITRYTDDVFDPVKSDLPYLNGSLQQSFRYIEMPFFLRYKVLNRGIDLNLIGGLSYNLLISNSVYAISEGSKYMIGRTEGLNPFTISSSVGMGMEYSFSDRVSLNLEPTFRYYLNPFTPVPGLKTHPYSFGIFSGLSYKF